LREQTLQDFEWVVGDDGSSDGTRELVLAWQQEARFPIHYFWQENQHKKTAFNRGVREARGELLVALDSDDSLDRNALYTMAQAVGGGDVARPGLGERQDGRSVGGLFREEGIVGAVLHMAFQHQVKGEKFGCMRTEVLRQFPFPGAV